jgi:hypothetical protein
MEIILSKFVAKKAHQTLKMQVEQGDQSPLLAFVGMTLTNAAA